MSYQELRTADQHVVDNDEPPPLEPIKEFYWIGTHRRTLVFNEPGRPLHNLPVQFCVPGKATTMRCDPLGDLKDSAHPKKGCDEEDPALAEYVLFLGAPDGTDEKEEFKIMCDLVREEETPVLFNSALRGKNKGIVWEDGKGELSLLLGMPAFARIRMDNRLTYEPKRLKVFNLSNQLIEPHHVPWCLAKFKFCVVERAAE
ncbi:hypothetical protein BDN72DRAFT_906967 [Pluteus cervinus]|uniref:Uncharacterized protein n=1 Tax=Pluteus cervinus TaxID=181527 RepID=A0ACD2ZXS5_9AGAR|nr:hypothetical protein BDN72DRAFT_906967 [Pluteus cervinus]